ncbi:DUF2171 domain-containing protein [Corallococcus praedator]|uniref:DUF2171 domain-containing protein n=1 Tax=Corallococcus praedator TaxID=2316724 RepID=A0ABX9QPN9_9BACT|nr:MULTISPECIES: DUF2171 domain-containing protein [Corallococcus]RKH18453.1 DUF2171 domain-containing protein [Corallococcus sp. CA047B]RKH32998.1 DUF2171 domain-containing protein [Corallococcus sp. CA031C]RKI13528.1 DUF2171 domain-containing protein [Corallococcus praedator]
MIHAGDVREGMAVLAADGQKLGRVAGVGDTHFELEQGLVPIPRRDYLIEYSDVEAVREDEILLKPADHPQLALEEDDDGGALPPRNSEGMDAEPANDPVGPMRH